MKFDLGIQVREGGRIQVAGTLALLFSAPGGPWAFPAHFATGFVLGAGIDRLDDIERYVRAIVYRLDHLAGAGERDQRRMAEVVPLERRYTDIVDTAGPGKLSAELVDVRWQLEEFRVATFAQPLMVKRPGQPPVSAKRIAALLAR
mgnify:CR=1 FL=1